MWYGMLYHSTDNVFCYSTHPKQSKMTQLPVGLISEVMSTVHSEQFTGTIVFDQTTVLWTLCKISSGVANNCVFGVDPKLNPQDFVCFFWGGCSTTPSGLGKYVGIRRKSTVSCHIERALIECSGIVIYTNTSTVCFYWKFFNSYVLGFWVIIILTRILIRYG